MEICDIVMKLIGDVSPIGDFSRDADRLENLKKLCALTEKLVTIIDGVSYNNADSYEHSRKIAGEYARNFLTKDIGITE